VCPAAACPAGSRGAGCHTAQAARVFRLAGLHPGPDLDAYAIAALAGTGLDHAAELLGALAHAHLVHATATGRHGMHDLLRAYAVRLAGERDSERARRAALRRLLDYYLAATAAAVSYLQPAGTGYRPRVPASGTPVPTLADADAARAWLDAERPCLVAMTAHAAAHGWPGHAVQLQPAATLARYLDSGRYTTNPQQLTRANRRHDPHLPRTPRQGDRSPSTKQSTNRRHPRGTLPGNEPDAAGSLPHRTGAHETKQREVSLE